MGGWGTSPSERANGDLCGDDAGLEGSDVIRAQIVLARKGAILRRKKAAFLLRWTGFGAVSVFRSCHL